jgi:hypothetical protein
VDTVWEECTVLRLVFHWALTCNVVITLPQSASKAPQKSMGAGMARVVGTDLYAGTSKISTTPACEIMKEANAAVSDGISLWYT